VHPEAKHVANFIRDVSAGKVIVILIRTVHWMPRITRNYAVLCDRLA
jgi:hypothetical protein